jgi:hypothetical protein
MVPEVSGNLAENREDDMEPQLSSANTQERAPSRHDGVKGLLIRAFLLLEMD